jgi:hypothetical protein
MTTYPDLHWDSLRFVKTHLYRRLATPLNNALGRLAIARHVNDPAEAREQYRRVEQNLEIALNLVKAWAALIHVKSGGTIRQAQYRQITRLLFGSGTPYRCWSTRRRFTKACCC